MMNISFEWLNSKTTSQKFGFHQELARHTLDRLRGRVVSFEEEAISDQFCWDIQRSQN